MIANTVNYTLYTHDNLLKSLNHQTWSLETLLLFHVDGELHLAGVLAQLLLQLPPDLRHGSHLGGCSQPHLDTIKQSSDTHL